jgi:hypothetical protein
MRTSKETKEEAEACGTHHPKVRCGLPSLILSQGDSAQVDSRSDAEPMRNLWLPDVAWSSEACSQVGLIWSHRALTISVGACRASHSLSHSRD